MRILDIFSWLPAKELSIEKIEELVESLNNGIENNEGYSLKKKLPENSNDRITDEYRYLPIPMAMFL